MPNGKRTLSRTERRGDNTLMDDCNKVSDYQLHEDDSAARNYKLNAIYADTYMKYVKLEPGSLAERCSSRFIKTSNTYLMYLA